MDGIDGRDGRDKMKRIKGMSLVLGMGRDRESE